MCWIIPLIVGLISALLGYLLGKRCCENSPFVTNLKAENDKLRGQLSDCEANRALLIEEKESLKVSFAEQQKQQVSFQSNVDKEKVTDKVKGKVKGIVSHFAKTDNADETEYNQEKASHFASTDDTAEFHSHKEGTQATSHFATTDDSEDFHSEGKGSKVISHFASTNSDSNTDKAIAFDADLAKSVFGKKIKQDDLTVVEGIGPKIAELFHHSGIKTWKALSETSVERCQEILTAGGSRFAIHTPNTWPRQAEMAYKGKWQALFDWQEKLDGGVET